MPVPTLAPPRHPGRRQAIQAAAAILLGAAAARGRTQGKVDRPRVTLAVGQRTALASLPLTVAEQLGFFAAEGVQVELIDHADPARAMQALASGTAEVASGGFEQAVWMQARGQPVRAFVLQSRTPQVALGVATRAQPPLQALADLRGRRIGVANGDASALVATAALQAAGVPPASVQFVPMANAPTALAALRAGQLDALCHTDPLMTQLEHSGEVRIVCDTRTLKGTQRVFGGPMPATCLYAPDDFLRRQPATAQALANAIVHALKWLQTAGPRDMIQTVPEAHLLGDRALYLASFEKLREAISPDGLLPDDGVRTAIRAVAAFDPAVRADRIAPGQLYTNDFTRKAKERFKA